MSKRERERERERVLKEERENEKTTSVQGGGEKKGKKGHKMIHTETSFKTPT